MAQSTDEECGICLDALANPVALPCSHKFCSKCLDSWRSKYGSQGDKKKMERVCPLCREKIPPSKEMITQLESYRSLMSKMETAGDAASSGYMLVKSAVAHLEQEVGDWTEALAYADEPGEEGMVLPQTIFVAARCGDVQKVLDWLGPPPVDKQRINAKCAEYLNTALVLAALMSSNSNLLSILLQFGADVNALNAAGVTPFSMGRELEDYQQARLLLEWGAEIDPQHFGATTKEEVVSMVLKAGNAKLATLLKSELGGRRCELVDFSTRPELNGRTCVVEKHLPDRDRYKIAFEGSGEKALVPPDNLKRRDRTPTDCGYYITFENGRYSRRDFASKEECQAYVAELESKHATEQLASLNIGASGSSKGRRGKKGKKKGRK